MTVAEQLRDLAVIRQILMERLIAGQQRDMKKLLDQVAASLERKLKGPELSEAQARRVNQTIAELKAAVRIGPPDLSELAVTEAAYLQTKLAKIGIGTALPTEAALSRISSRPLVQGAAIGTWFSNLEDTLRFDIERIVRIGVSIGRTNREIAKEILGDGSERGPEVFARTRRNAMALTRTATQTVTNDARMSFYDGNDDIFKGVQWVSTLDNRTSVQCMALAGLVWTLPYLEPDGHSMEWGGPPPAHWNCRSTVIGVARSISELTGKKASQIAPRTRASMDGSVAQDISFDEWLRGKPKALADEMLGKGRAELWREKKITLQQLLDQRGNPITMQELRDKYS